MRKLKYLVLALLCSNAFADEINLQPKMEDQYCKFGQVCQLHATYDITVTNTADHVKHYKFAYQIWPHIHNQKQEIEEFDIAPGQTFIHHYEMDMGWTYTAYKRNTVQIYLFAESDKRQSQKAIGVVYLS